MKKMKKKGKKNSFSITTNGLDLAAQVQGSGSGFERGAGPLSTLQLSNPSARNATHLSLIRQQVGNSQSETTTALGARPVCIHGVCGGGEKGSGRWEGEDWGRGGVPGTSRRRGWCGWGNGNGYSHLTNTAFCKTLDIAEVCLYCYEREGSRGGGGGGRGERQWGQQVTGFTGFVRVANTRKIRKATH